jgi:hypothetical protein
MSGVLVTEAFRAASLYIHPEKDMHTVNYGDVSICVEGRSRFVTIVCNMQPTTNRESRQRHIAKLFHIIQGVTGGTDQTSGECSLGQTVPI